MKIAIGADHRGHKNKDLLREMLISQGHDVIDFGPSDATLSDYPDTGFPVATCVSEKKADVGILLCGTGIGMSIVANKVKGIRAALVHDELTANMSRQHNNANVLCLASDMLSEELMRRLVQVWLTSEYEGGRHDRRVGKITAFEEGEC